MLFLEGEDSAAPAERRSSHESDACHIADIHADSSGARTACEQHCPHDQGPRGTSRRERPASETLEVHANTYVHQGNREKIDVPAGANLGLDVPGLYRYIKYRT